MAILATLVGAAAGAWLAVWRTRSRHMQSALATAFQNIDGMDVGASQMLAAEVLSDRLVKARAPWRSVPDPMEWPVVGVVVRMARGFVSETIHREELALLVLRKAAQGDVPALTALNLAVRTGWTAAAEAGERLRHVERAMLAAEVDAPSQPAQVWRTRALQAVVPELAAQLFAHYDNLMDRVEDNVVASGKVASMVAAAMFLYFAPVDSVAMLNRLSRDAKLRGEVVAAAVEVKAAAPAEAGQALEKARAKLEDAGLFGEVNLGGVPLQWPAGGLTLRWPDLRPGVLITWAMVSMGGPFWLGLLNRLLGLRSVVAQRGGEQRALRRQEQ